MLSDDLAAIYADTSLTVSVQYGSPVQSARGFLSTEDTLEDDGHGGGVVVSRRTVTILSGAITGLASDDQLVVDGVTYQLHGRPRVAGRGKVRLVLAEVAS